MKLILSIVLLAIIVAGSPFSSLGIQTSFAVSSILLNGDTNFVAKNNSSVTVNNLGYTGKQDLLVSNYNSNHVSTVLNNSQTPPLIPIIHKILILQKSLSIKSTLGPHTTFTATQNGDWNSGSTWQGGIVPGALDDKIILLGINVTVTTEVENNGTITNSGTITVANSDTSSIGIYNYGNVTNNSEGQINVVNTGVDSDGVVSWGPIANSGTVTVLNSGSNSYGIQNSNVLSNSGTIMISNSGYIGILNIAAFSNYGTIAISNSVNPSYGIVNYEYNNNSGIITNNSSGTITVANSGAGTQGIYNFIIITNNSGGQITISNSGDYGIANGGTLTNSGTITVSNSGPYGIYNQYTFTNNSGGQITIINSGNYGIVNDSGSTLTNFGIITVSNSGPSSYGIDNTYGTITNNGTINLTCGGTVLGTIPTSGNPVITIACIAITSTSNSSPRWNVDPVSVSGTVTGSVSGDTVTISWGDGTNSTGNAITGTSWGPVVHSYGSSAISTNPNNVIAILVSSANVVKTTSAPSQVNVQKHATSLTLAPIGNVPWGRPAFFSATLKDTDAGVAIPSRTIIFNGTGVINVANVSTNATGVAVGHGNGPSSVATGWMVQALFAGDSSYKSSKSLVNPYSTTKHNTALALVQPVNVPWSSRPTSLTATLADSSAGGIRVSSKIISFNGTGVISVANVSTNATGVAIGHGTSPSTVATGWKEQARFAGDMLYNPANSAIRNFNTLVHNTSLTLTLTPTSLVHGTKYNATGTLRDTTANIALGSRTITFTATSPIIIPSATTSTTGVYSVTGLVSPSTAGSYSITSHFAATSLYGASNSPARTLTVS